MTFSKRNWTWELEKWGEGGGGSMRVEVGQGTQLPSQQPKTMRPIQLISSQSSQRIDCGDN
jgi:hypothetical protein